MRVFISWSGAQSKKLAEALRDWLPGVLQLVRPYFTPSDIEKGTRWASEIAKELESSEVGILCITRDNIHSDWMMFEAGALSKSLGKAHVCPVLFGITNTDLAGPLKQFQTTECTKQDFHKMIAVINGKLGEHKLPTKTLDSVFEKWWPELDQQVTAILEEDVKNMEPIRSERDLLVEVLEITRANSKRMASSSSGINPKMITELVEGFIQLHDEQLNNVGGYQDTLDAMKSMSPAINYIIKHFKGAAAELENLSENFSALTYVANEKNE